MGAEGDTLSLSEILGDLLRTERPLIKECSSSVSATLERDLIFLFFLR